MNILQGVFVVVLLLEITACQGNENCRSRPYAVEEGRRCRSPCAGRGATCKATNKKCLCDGACGWSCYNPAAPCAELEPILHGTFDADNIMQGKANYRCDTGYIVDGPRRRTCCADKKWHPEAPTCTPGCELPGNLGNAYPDTSKSSFAIREEVKYKCRTGYHMSGNAYRTCQNSGWTSAQYTCHLQTCSSLSERVYHGSVEFNPGFYFGSTAKLICDTGYEARDPWRVVTSIRCFAGEDNSRYGEWTGELSSCEIKTCPPPMEPQDGQIRDRSFVGRDYGTLITYECDLGFKLEGSETGQCDDDGSWGTMPNCTVDPDCDFDEYSHPTCGYDGDNWERIRVTEVDGLQGYASEATQKYSQLTSALIPSDWTTSESICLKFNYMLVGTYSSFKISPTDRHRNSDISWRSHGKEVKNTWLDSLLNIRTRNPIQYKFEVIDPTIQLDNIQVLGHACVDACDNTPSPCQHGGTCVSRSAGRTCFCTITFKGSDCEIDRKCRTPPDTPGYGRNAKLTDTQPHKIYNELLPESTATYSCDENYKVPASGYSNLPVTTVKTHCIEGSSGSSWSPNPYNIRCVEILCTQPPLKENQELVSRKTWSNWRVGEEATVRCADGYGFVSEKAVKFVTCGSNERWIGEFTKCQDVRCPTPSSSIQNGYRSYLSDDSWFSGTKATYSCNSYHKFRNENSVVTSKNSHCERRWFGGESYWKPDISSFRCIDRRCSVAPDRMGNAHREEPEVATNTFMPRDQAEYRCEQYHKLSGAGYHDSIETSVTTTCMEGSRNNPSFWSPSINSINCVDRRCPEATESSVQHASRVNASDTANFLPGSWAEYRCNEHYKLTGTGFEDSLKFRVTTTCNEGHQDNPSYWSLSLGNIRCIDRRCSVPPESVRNATRVRSQGTDETFLPGSSVTYNCKPNHKLVGTGYDHLIRTTVTTTCKEGSSGTPSYWSRRISGIACKAITCSKPDPIGPHQFIRKYQDGKEWNVGQRARYACKKGYEFDPNDKQKTNTKKCTASETWEGSVKRCIENIKCDPPQESIANGNLSSKSQNPFFPNATATYVCDNGFKLDGEDGVIATKTVTCKKRLNDQLGSDWAPKISTLNCIPITCSTPSAGNHQRIADNQNGKKWNIGEQAIYSCKQGYEFASDDPAVIKTCNDDESWEGTVTECTENIKCIVPLETITNGERSPLSEDPPFPNANVTYRCNPNYKMANEKGLVIRKTLECRKKEIGSEWEPKLSTIHCIAKTCTNPSTGIHQRIEGYKKGKFWEVGEQATFSCMEGYKFDSDEPTTSMTCRDDETWEGSITACIENTECDIPQAEILNGEQVTSFNSPPPRNTTATYRCSAGFKLEIEHEITLNKTIECRKKANSGAGSEWVPKPSQISCIRLSCGNPNVANGQELTEDKEKWYAGDRATYRCKNGYEMNPSTENPVTTITCSESESWSEAATACVEDVKCEAPRQTIEHGSLTPMTSGRAVRGTTVTYGCDEGYVFGIENEATSTCTMKSNGEPGSEWIPNLEDIECTLATANVKLDLAVLLPRAHSYSKTSINAYKSWVKALRRTLVPKFDLHAEFYQYGYSYGYYLHSKGLPDVENNDSEFELAVDDMSLTAYGHSSYLSQWIMTEVISRMNGWTRSGAIKAAITLVDRKPYRSSSSIAEGVDCIKYYDANAYFVGVIPDRDTAAFEQRIEDMASNIDGEKRWFTIALSELENSVSSLVKTIEEQSLPRDQRNICGALPNPPSDWACRWQDAGQKSAGEKVHLECRESYDSNYYTRRQYHVQCKSDGSWKERDSNPCSSRRKRRSVSPFGRPWKVLGNNERRSEQNRRHRTRRTHDGDRGRGEDEGQQRWGFHDDDYEWRREDDDDDERQRSSGNHRDDDEWWADDDEEGGRSHHDDDEDDYWGREDNEEQRRRRFHEDERQADDDEERRGIHDYDDAWGMGEDEGHGRSRPHNDDDDDEWSREYGGRHRWKPEGDASSHCRDPVLPDKAIIINDPVTYNQGTKITLGCLGDNTLIGRNRIKCKASGQWTKTNAVCKANTCAVDAFTLPNDMLVDGESIYYEKFRVGESITIECDDPFVLYRDPRRPPIIETEVTCNLGGRWSESLSSFSCDTGASICACPNKPESSSIVNDPNHYPVGITISLECDPGFELIGEDTMTCLQTGHWDDARFSCEDRDGLPPENIQDCEAPELPDQAVIEDDPEDYPPGTTITLDCIGDNDLIGCPRMTCNRIGQWSECESRCEANVCLLDRVLMPLRMGVEGYTSVEVYDHKFDIDEVATLTCDGRQFPFLEDGGDFIQPDITCQPGGRWEPNVYDFQCVTACLTPTEPPNARWVREPSSEVYRVGNRIAFVCLDGWAYEGDVRTVECQDDGEWSIPEDACIEIAPDCVAPDLPDQAIIEDDPEGYLPGTMITLDCIGDNDLIGCSRMTCNRFGQWSECESRCEANVCLLDRLLMPLGMGVDGYTSVEVYDHKFDIDEVATLTCEGRRFPFPNDGGNFIQPDITCQPGGRWEPNAHDFHCASACGTPTEPPNARWVREPSNEVFRVGNRISFVCVDGCIYGGDVRTVECQDNGIWSIPEHACIEINECDPNPCRNGGRCTDLINDFVCDCVEGYSGKTCQIDIDDCDPDPCQNDGSCIDGDNDYSCLCPPGYTGKNCQTDINDCVPNPCKNGGLCFDRVNNFSCACITGFAGRSCETNINDCSPNPCLNGASCTDQVNGFACSCQPGYTDHRCQTDIDDCSPNPCLNDAGCTDQVNGFSCSCQAGYTGDRCETDVDDCSPNPCLNDAECTDLVNGNNCICQTGYTGDRCQTDINDCIPNPCQNGGLCFDRVNNFSCACITGFAGKSCETNIDDCSPNPCRNGGQCTDSTDDFSCTCSPGYAGKICSIDVNDCVPNRCLNGATCVDGANSYRCICFPGFVGSRCQINENECNSNPCQNGATCNDLVADFRCECFAGFTGKTCGTNINDCSPNPCLNGAVCTDQVNGFDCRCLPGYTGDRCQTDIDDCSPYPCLNDAECEDEVNGYNCICQPGYTDVRCQTDIDDCSPNPCLNDAECADQVNGHNCICQPGYTGDRCQTDIDDCSPNPCLNDAECADEVNGYNCICQPGYTGDRCQTDIDDCSPYPCLNDAECEDEVNGYNCICQPGYSGARCQTDIDDCSPNPCLNDAECTDQVNGFTCSCQPGYTGDQCQTDENNCSPDPCMNDGTCSDLVNDFSCECAEGYAGKRCETNIKICDPNPCRHVERCENLVNDYLCHCIPGYTGKRCEDEIDECAAGPCINGGHCTDKVNDFECTCAAGYTGKTCAIDIDDCDPYPCHNNARCEDRVNSFTCICDAGFTGRRCETDINECLLSPYPCQNDGNCNNRIGTFLCECLPGYTGTLCEIVLTTTSTTTTSIASTVSTRSSTTEPTPPPTPGRATTTTTTVDSSDYEYVDAER